LGIKEEAKIAEEELMDQHSEIQTLRKQLEECQQRRSEVLDKYWALKDLIKAALKVMKLGALEDEEP